MTTKNNYKALEECRKDVHTHLSHIYDLLDKMISILNSDDRNPDIVKDLKNKFMDSHSFLNFCFRKSSVTGQRLTITDMYARKKL